ncbi:MAG: HlyD family efflux transporter periplasmic adaptor subunit, partial [Desulfocucumaceae bacterium]
MGRDIDSGTRPQKEGRRKIRPLYVVLFVIIVSILYIAVVQLMHLARMKMVETGALEAGELKVLYSAEGIIIRNETAIAAPADGELVMLAKPGDRVRAGDSIAEVKTAGADPGVQATSALVRATRTGVVSFQTDGLEGVLKPGQN